MAWPRPSGRGKDGDDSVGAGGIGVAQRLVEVPRVRHEVIAEVEHAHPQAVGLELGDQYLGEAAVGGEDDGRGGGVVRRPACPGHGSVRRRAPGRRRAGARCPRVGSRRAAAAGAGRSCSRRSCSRPRSGSGPPSRITSVAGSSDVTEVGEHVGGGRRADPAEGVGGRGGDAPTRTGQELLRQRMRRRPQPDGVPAAGHRVEHPRGPRQQHGERSRPAGGGEQLGRRRDIGPPTRGAPRGRLTCTMSG